MKAPLPFTTILLLLAVMLLPCTTKAQSESTENVVALTYLTPGVSYEMKTGQYQTIHLRAYLSFAASYHTSPGGDEFNVYLDPSLAAQYRFYYNFKKRLSKQKRTEKNSANYFAAHAGTVFTKMRISSSYFQEETRRPVCNVGVRWGMQRNMAKKLNFNFSFGAGVTWASSSYPIEGGIAKETHVKFNLPVHLGLGIWLGKNSGESK